MIILEEIENWLATNADLGSLMRARTKIPTGDEAGIFTVETRPTAAQVDDILGIAAVDVSEIVGIDLPEITWGMARTAGIYRAAMLVELSYFPEQVASGKSAYQFYERIYNEKMKTLALAIEQAGAGDLPGSVDDAMLPSYGGFPNTGIGMEFNW